MKRCKTFIFLLALAAFAAWICLSYHIHDADCLNWDQCSLASWIASFALGLVGLANLIAALLGVLLLFSILLGYLYSPAYPVTGEKKFPPSMKTDSLPVLEALPMEDDQGSWIKALLRLFFDRRQWRLTQDWTCTLGNGQQVVLPQGFVTDGVSVPKMFIVEPMGIWLKAGLLHDFAYAFGYLPLADNGQFGLKNTRGDWDRLFLIECNRANALRGLNYFGYLALALFGCLAWNEHREREKAAA